MSIETCVYFSLVNRVIYPSISLTRFSPHTRTHIRTPYTNTPFPPLPHAGILTTSDLKIRFAVVRGEVRHETFVPEGANHIIGQAVGYTIANFVSAPR